jgi:carbonic anhydrase
LPNSIFTAFLNTFRLTSWPVLSRQPDGAPGLSAGTGDEVKTSVTADEALQHLLEGNRRYSSNRVTDLNQTPVRRIEVAQAQYPFATIFGCVDSRVPPEIIFDRGLGDLLVIRTAGQVVDWAVLGSIEFGVAELGIPLIMVLGHERCGAIKATIEMLEKGLDAPGQIELLVESIRPAVEESKGQPGNLLENAVQANIELTVSQLKTSPILAKAIAKNQLKIVGARYDLDTGAVALTVS